MTVYAPLNASHFSQILSIGTQVFREDDVSVLGDALHTACAPSCVSLAPDGTVAAFTVFCQGSPLSTRISSYHSHYTSLFERIGCVLGATGELYELAFLAVHPLHQGAGLGSKLLRHCLGDLKTQKGGEAPAWLVVDAENVGAQRLYERHGFAVVAPLLKTPYPSLLMFRLPEKIEIWKAVWLRAVLLINPITQGDADQSALDASGEADRLPSGELWDSGRHAHACDRVCRPEPLLALRV